jgi:peptidoglycan/xylan/chitin deacetylase (PgdA/CDA1 family)
MTPLIKRAAGHAIFASRLDTVFLRNRALVVTFHRVNDTRSPEGLTVSPRVFERYCRFFSRHFRVVPLRTLVKRLERREALNRELAITFDDGYRDNFENAVPLLEKYRLPATFFVVTRFIGTDIVPWWDEQKGVRHPWMTWDQVRSLHERGFDLGAHTRTHVDLGVAGGSEANEEILGGRRELEDRLAAPVELFAYPYGRRGNLADANRRLVRGAGFRCCCSCFGGTVARGSDPFHLQRVPISSRYESPEQFGFDVALGRSLQPA